MTDSIVDWVELSLSFCEKMSFKLLLGTMTYSGLARNVTRLRVITVVKSRSAKINGLFSGLYQPRAEGSQTDAGPSST